MNIVIDAFGGDNAPLEVIKGSIDAQKDFGVDVTLVGDEEKIKKCAQENGLDITALHIKHADTVIEICEEPTESIKHKSKYNYIKNRRYHLRKWCMISNNCIKM